jgi:carbamate kinase
LLLHLTDADAVYAGFGKRAARPLAKIDPSAMDETQFPAGSTRRPASRKPGVEPS